MLEHFAQTWGRLTGLNCAHTVYHSLGSGLGVVRVLRFDRQDEQRLMALSGASLLQTEYPGQTATAQWSYPRLAEELRMIGCPPEDQVELFGRMVFNAVCGNDDDHPRNHAVIYQPQEKRWRLSPAFDVVPNPDADMAPVLSMQISLGRHETMREAMLADSVRFGFSERDAAVGCLNDLLQRIEHSFDAAAQLLTDELREMMVGRMRKHISLLRT